MLPQGIQSSSSTVLMGREQIMPRSGRIAAAGYAIRRRANTGTFTASRTKANTEAATSVPATAKVGKGVMANPPMASVAAIITSATDDAASHRLGRDPHRCRR